MNEGIWDLDPEVTFLNHGSYGACPRGVLAAQERLRARMERNPVAFLGRELWDLLDAARLELGAFAGADPEGLAFVPNVTTGVNTVLRALRLEPGDELLLTDHAYGACRNAALEVARATGARVVEARVPFPLASPAEVVEAVLRAAGPRTRLAMLDHVTSPTALVLPVEELVPALAERGVETLVDGAHAPGMVDLALDRLGAAFYSGNCHKWLCAPKGTGFLWVRADLRDRVRPLVLSHGAGLPRPRFREEHDWTGTCDPTGYLCVPEAIRQLGALVPGGWPGLRAENRALCRAGREVLLRALGTPAPCPAEMLGSMASVVLPDAPSLAGPWPRGVDPLQRALLTRHRLEVPVMPWPRAPRRLLRISAQRYNEIAQYEALAEALVQEMGRERE